MNTSFYTEFELRNLGFKSVGDHVLISKKCSIYGPEKMTLGNNIRIDDFCILSGNICLGSNIHISAYTALYGTYGITIGNFCGLSPRCTIFSASDDFSGESLVGPMFPSEYNKLKSGPVILHDYAHLCSGVYVMPDVEIGEGAVVGAMSFVSHNLSEWNIWVSHREKMTILKSRDKKMLQLANQFNEISWK